MPQERSSTDHNSSAPGTAMLVSGGIARRSVGAGLVVTAGLLFWLATMLDWGMSPIAWVPALVLLILAAGLWTIRRSHVADAHLVIDVGHGVYHLATTSLRVEKCPTAGLHAVMVHCHSERVALATWLTSAKAEQVIAWLEQQLGRPLERIETEPHRLDR